MQTEFAHAQAQRYLAQRNRFAGLSAILAATSVLGIGAAITRDEQVVLVPVTAETLTVSSGGIDTHYLELVTRDTALIRIADIDTPEITSPKCNAEYERGIRARDRLVVLLNGGEFELRPIGNRDKDQYGRKLRVIMRSGRSLGDQLVSESLARTWTGRRESWC